MSEIAGRKVLITGAASGIGRRMAERVSERGGRVIAWDIDAPRLEALVDALRARGGEARGDVCDISNRRAVYEAADRLKAELGPVDILVNNAGIVSGKSLLELSDAQIEKTFAINTLSLFWTTRAFLPAMIEQGRGHVVTIASAAGLVGVARLSDYCASKWAAVGFDESLRVELAKSAPFLKTTVVCPYYIDTGMFKGVKTRFPLLLPILAEKYVADHIVNAILRDDARLILPLLLRLAPVLRILPTRVFDSVMNLLGVNASMDTFVGRGSRTSEARSYANARAASSNATKEYPSPESVASASPCASSRASSGIRSSG